MLSHHFSATFCFELSSVLMSILDWTNLLPRWNDSLIWDVGTERVHASKTSRCYQRRQLMIAVTETSVPQRFSVHNIPSSDLRNSFLGPFAMMTLYAGIGALVCVIWWLLSALVTARVLRTDPPAIPSPEPSPCVVNSYSSSQVIPGHQQDKEPRAREKSETTRKRGWRADEASSYNLLRDWVIEQFRE